MLGEVSKHLDMKLWKPKECFVGNESLHKNLSRFLHNYHGLGVTKIFLDPRFQEFAGFIFLKKSHGQQLTSHFIHSTW
jgi:hypothetical protein